MHHEFLELMLRMPPEFAAAALLHCCDVDRHYARLQPRVVRAF